jgi:hypothetical protein
MGQVGIITSQIQMTGSSQGLDKQEDCLSKFLNHLGDAFHCKYFLHQQI